jgi:predicted outer membrane repeat protein
LSGCTDVAPTLATASATPVAACTQAALVTAIAQVGNGSIRLPAGCSLTLTSPIQVNQDLTIEGNSATISGNNTTQLFIVNRNNALSRGYNFALQNATLTQGYDTTTGGAAVRGAQFGSMTFVNVTMTNNTSASTGGEDGGGAIFKDEGGKLTIFNSTFSGNTATNGGAIKSNGADVQVVNSTFDSNHARGGNNGGGAYFLDGLESLTPKTPISQGGYAPDGYTVDTYGKGRFCGVLFRNNSVAGSYDANQTGRQGGGLFTHTYTKSGNIPGTTFTVQPGYSLIEVERSVFVGNTSYDSGGALRLGGDGGGVFAAITSDTFLQNVAGNHGGAIRLSSANANFRNLTIAGNCANVNGNVADCTSTSTAGGIGGGIVAFENQYNLDRVTLLSNRSASYGGATSQNTGVSIPGSLTNSLIINNKAANPYNGITNNCAGPLFTSGANSYEWPSPQFNQYDAGCGASNIADPQLSTPTSCSTIAGSSQTGMSLSHSVYLPSATGPVARSSGVPAAGAVCPDELP